MAEMATCEHCEVLGALRGSERTTQAGQVGGESKAQRGEGSPCQQRARTRTRTPRDPHLPSAPPESTRAHELCPGTHGTSLLPSKGMASSTRNPAQSRRREAMGRCPAQNDRWLVTSLVWPSLQLQRVGPRTEGGKPHGSRVYALYEPPLAWTSSLHFPVPTTPGTGQATGEPRLLFSKNNPSRTSVPTALAELPPPPWEGARDVEPALPFPGLGRLP